MKIMKKDSGCLFNLLFVLGVIALSSFIGYNLGQDYVVRETKREMLQAEIEKERKSKGRTAEIMTEIAKEQMEDYIDKKHVLIKRLIELSQNGSLNKEDEMFVIKTIQEISALD